ncbi:MAG: heme-copper oxidase subunit III [Chloroflexi bacterium]|nr:heme-copper oxidase subunit III [Chloroflexota bacterium]
MSVTAHTTTVAHHEEPGAPMGKAELGILAFLATEAIFFGLLILSYVYFRVTDNSAPNADILKPNFIRTLIFSLCLFASSGTIVLAEQALKKGNRRGLVLWLVVTVVLGLAFLSGQGWEYAELIGENITPARNTFGTAFFTMTGFHGFHVFGGLVMLSILAGLAAAGDFKGPHSAAVTCVSWYWHFVDIVWVFIFSMVYVLPALGII